jgi:hypothetical protein
MLELLRAWTVLILASGEMLRIGHMMGDPASLLFWNRCTWRNLVASLAQQKGQLERLFALT